MNEYVSIDIVCVYIDQDENDENDCNDDSDDNYIQ